MELYKNTRYKVIARFAATSDVVTAYYELPRHVRGPAPLESLCLYDGVGAYDAWYEVVSLETGVAEHRCPTLPEALSAAHNLEDQLIEKPWIAALANQKAFHKSMMEEQAALAGDTPVPVTPIN
jgi:hypothetical protein